VRLCYKRVQEIEGPWIAARDVPMHGSSPGVWLCWGQLGSRLVGSLRMGDERAGGRGDCEPGEAAFAAGARL